MNTKSLEMDSCIFEEDKLYLRELNEVEGSRFLLIQSSEAINLEKSTFIGKSSTQCELGSEADLSSDKTGIRLITVSEFTLSDSTMSNNHGNRKGEDSNRIN